MTDDNVCIVIYFYKHTTNIYLFKVIILMLTFSILTNMLIKNNVCI